MEQKLLKIAKFLTGIDIPIIYDEHYYNACCDVDRNTGDINEIIIGGECIRESKRKGLSKLLVDNIEYFEDEKEKNEFENLDDGIIIFLHELSHGLIPMSDKIMYMYKNQKRLYRRMSYSLDFITSNKLYRKMILEKMADNLAYLLYKFNKKVIREMYYNNNLDFETSNQVLENTNNLVNKIKNDLSKDEVYKDYFKNEEEKPRYNKDLNWQRDYDIKIGVDITS
jgi:hypothetical protein